MDDDNDYEAPAEARKRREGGGVFFEMSTYLIVDSTLCDGVFITNFGFDFPLAFRLFPWGN